MIQDFSLSFTPLLPTLGLAVIGLLALTLTLLGLFNRRPGTLLRALAFALLLAALANPALVKEIRSPLKDVVAVVVDHSGSQSIGERSAQTEAASKDIIGQLHALGNLDTRVIQVDGNSGGARGTRLFHALNNGLTDVPPERVGGVVMITDGVVHDIPASLAQLGIKAPLHALITGHKGERDRRIELIEAPKFGIVGKELTITARVLDTGHGNEPVVLHVRRDNAIVGEMNAVAGQKIEVPVRIDHGGTNVIELSVDPIPGELTTLNNHVVLSVDGVRDKLKVLLVSGEPHAGERMWRNILKSDPNVDLVHFTILRPPEKNDGTPVNQLALIAFPVSDLFGKKIKNFDLIIFDRYSNLNILPDAYLENIVEYVHAGGALLLAAGPEFARAGSLYYSPLGDILPASPAGAEIEKPFAVTLSQIGKLHPVTRDLERGSGPKPSDWFRQIVVKQRRGDNILNGADGRPLLVLSHEKRGRVAMLLSDQMWLWARDYKGGGPYLELLRRLAHWLMKEPELAAEALRAQADGDGISIERQSLKPIVGSVTLQAPSGLGQQVVLQAAGPGLWRAHVKASEDGIYHLSEDNLTALVNVGEENPLEFQDVISTTAKLKPLAEATGGSVRRLTDQAGAAISVPRVVMMGDSPAYAGSDFIGIHHTGASRLLSIGISPLAIGFLGLLCLLGSVLVTWFAEGRRQSATLPRDA